MNRLDASPLPKPTPLSIDPVKAAPPTSPAPLFVGGVALSLSAAPLREEGHPPATTFTPVHYEEGYAYPLLVWLHGDGQTDRDLPTVMTHVSIRNYVAAAPRGERRGVGAGSRSGGGFGWCDSGDAIDAADERVAAAIETAASRFNVREDRIFLAGVGSGGTTALRLGLASPGRFAGVASLGGPMPLGGRPLRCVTRSRSLPMLLSAARESTAYPQTRLCRDLRLLHTAGSRVDIRQYPGAEELTTTMLSDLDAWMMGLVCGSR